MNGKTFDEIFEQQVAMCRSILVDKAAEYAYPDDRLRNFRIAAGLQGTNSRLALGGMLAKHIVSIFDLIAEGTCAPTPKWDEKITDAINYLFLLRAVTVEEIDSKGSTDAS